MSTRNEILMWIIASLFGFALVAIFVVEFVWRRRWFAGPIDMRDFPMCVRSELHEDDRLYEMNAEKDAGEVWVYTCECGCKFRYFSKGYWQLLKESDLAGGGGAELKR